MPPKPKSKKSSKRALQMQVRSCISTHSLTVVPNDAVEGYQERIETGIEWTLLEEAARRHKKMCKESAPPCTFADALKSKLDESFISAFLDADCSISLEDNWESILPMKLWDQEKFATKEEQTCFRCKNGITNDIEKLIKKAVRLGDRNVLREELKKISVLRLVDANITDVDESLLEFNKLCNLVLCGNFIKDIDSKHLPHNIKMLELQANAVSNVKSLSRKNKSRQLYYLGLARNLIDDDSVKHFSYLSYRLTVIDLGDNDIYFFSPVLDSLKRLKYLSSLSLAGNPCSVSMGYASAVLKSLPDLEWLDNREVVDTMPVVTPTSSKQKSQKKDPVDKHLDDCISGSFFFKVIRIMSIPPPPRLDKGAVGNYHLEVEVPLLDSVRRNFLMFHDNESLVQDIPEPEDGWPETYSYEKKESDADAIIEELNTSDVYNHSDTKTSRQILNYTVLKSHQFVWSNLVTIQDPVVSIFCPDLVALRDTFRSVITIRLVYTVGLATKTTKEKNQSKEKVTKDTSQQAQARPIDQRIVVATIKCPLQRPDWTQTAQHFHWDDSMNTEYALHWGNGNLEALTYYAVSQNSRSNLTKLTKSSGIDSNLRRPVPNTFTCHFSFGILTH